MVDLESESDLGGPRLTRPLWVAAVLVAVVTFAVFLPCLRGGFLNWDDDKNIVNNPHFRGLWPDNILWMLVTTHMGPYQPLSWLTLGVDYAIWGMNPLGYHLTNVLLHSVTAGVLCLATALLLMIRRSRLAGADGGAPLDAADSTPGAGVILASATAALAWAVHPQHVESVAWVTERRDVLSGLFYVLCVWAYLVAHRGGVTEWARHRWDRLATGFCALALLSKAMAVSIPVILLILDVYPLRRLDPRVWTWLRRPQRDRITEKYNYILFAALAMIVGFIGQSHIGALRSLDQVGFTGRLAIAAHAVAFYASKTIWPIGLAPLYPRPGIIAWSDPRFLYAGLAIVALTAVLIALRRRWPAGLVTWVSFVVILSPVCGLVTIGDELVADRYSYLPTIPFFVLFAGVLLAMWRARPTGVAALTMRAGLCVTALAVVMALGWRARHVMPIWHDSESLWRYAVARHPESYKAWNNLGTVYSEAKDNRRAERAYRKAVELRNDYARGYYNLGIALLRQQRQEDAERAFSKTLQLDPNNGPACVNLGTVLVWLDQSDRAIEILDRALRMDGVGSDPNNAAIVHFQLGEAHRKLNRYEEAAKQYTIAAKAKPKMLGIYAGLADVYLSLGRTADAEAAALRAQRLRPDRPEGWFAMAQVRTQQRQYDEALKSLRRAIFENDHYRRLALTDRHLRELRLEPRFGQMMRTLPALPSRPVDREPDS